MECQYALMTFGITQSLLPFNEQGVMDWRNFRNALEKRRVLEDERKLVCGNAIFCPLEFDVLLGRGRPFQEYTGNKRLAVIIDTRRQEYAASKRGGKTIVCDKIVELIQKSGGRFLKRQDENVHDGVWVEVDNSVARDKVSHGFRTKTRRNSLLSASVACKEGRATPDNGDMEASSLTF